MRIELAQIRKYSPSDDIVNEIIYFVYDNIFRIACTDMLSQRRNPNLHKNPLRMLCKGKKIDIIFMKVFSMAAGWAHLCAQTS